METARETSGTMTSLIVQHVRRVAGDDGVARVLERSGVEKSLGELEDEAGWSTYEDKVALWSAAAEVLGDPIVSRHMGETVLQTRVGTPLRLVLRAFGSPRMVLSNVAKVCPKFSTVATMQALEHSKRHIVVSYELHAGKQPHRLDCEANIGLMSAAGPLFGLPLLDVEHVECQVDGAPRCVYVVRWPMRRRLRLLHRATGHLEEQVDSLTAQVASLQSTAADLVSSEDKREVLARIVTRAAHAVSAQRYVLAVRAHDGGPIEVHHDGFDDAQARAVGAELLADDGITDDPSRIVIDVASAQRHYGRLAAFYDGHAFFDYERRLLAAYARSAAAALDAATALDEARRRGETATALLELARRLAVLSEPAQVGQQVAEAMGPVLGADCSFVFLIDHEREAFVVRGDDGWTREQRDFLRSLIVPHDADELIAQWVSSPAAVVVDHTTESPTGRIVLERLGVAAVAAVPIRRHDVVLGAAVAGFRDEVPYDVERLLERSAAIADQAATALENARLLAQVRHQATHDDLTGLPNRVLFEDAARRALHHSRRSRQPVALLFVDLDGFKAVNDDHGHAAGDALLAEVASRMQQGLRGGDVVARIGGDEFTVLLPGADEARALDVAERLRVALGEPVELAEGTVRVSACIGICVAPDDGAEYIDLLRAADGAMYRAKHLGRDRVERHEAA
jgi:diguanylate cyclase (GGDEF)-like protein